MEKLSREFFRRPTLDVARDLLGKVLVMGDTSGRINEVEAYIGQDDPACHATSGKTPRNAVMFGPAGHLYVYFTYGMYHCANIVTEKEGFPAAVLIRSIEPIEGKKRMIERRGKTKNIADGPGKLCMAMGITKEVHNALDLCTKKPDGVYDDGVQPKDVQSTPRIGIRVGQDKLWRFTC